MEDNLFKYTLNTLSHFYFPRDWDILAFCIKSVEEIGRRIIPKTEIDFILQVRVRPESIKHFIQSILEHFSQNFREHKS